MHPLTVALTQTQSLVTSLKYWSLSIPFPPSLMAPILQLGHSYGLVRDILTKVIIMMSMHTLS